MGVGKHGEMFDVTGFILRELIKNLAFTPKRKGKRHGETKHRSA